MTYIFIQYNEDYADEFTVHGFCAMEKSKWEEIFAHNRKVIGDKIFKEREKELTDIRNRYEPCRQFYTEELQNQVKSLGDSAYKVMYSNLPGDNHKHRLWECLLHGGVDKAIEQNSKYLCIDGYELYFGTNEFITFEHPDNYDFDVTDITDEDFHALERLFDQKDKVTFGFTKVFNWFDTNE